MKRDISLENVSIHMKYEARISSVLDTCGDGDGLWITFFHTL
jgi:hypothetical protein